MNNTADVIIVGGGVIGCAAAHLDEELESLLKCLDDILCALDFHISSLCELRDILGFLEAD